MKRSLAEKIFFLSRKLYLYKVPVLPRLLYLLNRVMFSCDIPFQCDIHPSVRILHNALGVVMHHTVRIGEGCEILQNVTIGVNGNKKAIHDGEEIIAPLIGSGVLLAAGSIIIGPITVGNNSRIGAGSVVTKSIPSNSLAVGSPAKVIKTYKGA